MSPILYTFIAGVVILLFFYWPVLNYWKKKGIPTARGCYPIMGHMLPVVTLKKTLSDVTQAIYDDYQNCSMVGILKRTVPGLIIRDPNVIKNVIVSNVSSFHQNATEFDADIDPLMSKHIFFNDGDVWLTGRKQLNYALTGSRLKSLSVVISGVCRKFQDFIDRRLKSSDVYEVDAKYLFTKFTGEVVANAGFGVEGRCFEDEDHPHAFDQIGHTLFDTSFLSRWTWMFIRLFPKLNRLTKLSFVSKEMDRFFRDIVDEYLSMKSKQSTPRFDFLQIMMDLAKKTGEEIDKDALTTHAFTFYADGLETSSITLCYVGYELAVHQDVQEKLRDEVKSVIKKHGDTITYEALNEMKYMEQVISESQRLRPVVGILQKVCTKECVLEGSDGLSCRVERDTHIILPIYSLHRDPKYWPDPDTFDPERFNPERKSTIEKMAFLPFGDGPRMCVGIRLAMLQMKACLATLLNNYRLELSPKTKLPLKTVVVLEMAMPVDLRIQISKL